MRACLLLNMKYIVLVLFVLNYIQYGYSVFIDGCPAYGCRPSGSFSFYLNVSKEGVDIDWETTFILDAVPNPLGCTSDTVSIVCQSNGPFSDNKGYVSLNRDNGTVRWRDKVLVYPTLPLLDNYGDVTGSDGESLVYYDADGKKYPIIDCRGLAPIYNIELIGSDFILLASAKGDIVVRLTNGVPVGYIVLEDTIDNEKGLFIPIAQPVVNGQRFYVLTEFVPHNGSIGYSTVQRLYAIDVRHSISDRITIGWFYTFKQNYDQLTFPFISSRDKHVGYIESKAKNGTQGLLWKSKSRTVFVILPSPFYATKISSSLWGLQDNGSKPILNFRSDFQAFHMTSFEKDHCDNTCVDETPVWVASEKEVCSVSIKGEFDSCFLLSDVLQNTGNISTKMYVVRNDDSDIDILIFGMVLTTSGSLSVTHYNSKLYFGIRSTYSILTAIEPTSPNPKVLWTLKLPDGFQIKGQVTGSSGSELTKDKLIFYAENDKGVARIYSAS